jgi:hypothetical protein
MLTKISLVSFENQWFIVEYSFVSEKLHFLKISSAWAQSAIEGLSLGFLVYIGIWCIPSWALPLRLRH